MSPLAPDQPLASMRLESQAGKRQKSLMAGVAYSKPTSVPMNRQIEGRLGFEQKPASHAQAASALIATIPLTAIGRLLLLAGTVRFLRSLSQRLSSGVIAPEIVIVAVLRVLLRSNRCERGMTGWRRTVRNHVMLCTL